jgi:hypothetical protein
MVMGASLTVMNTSLPLMSGSLMVGSASLMVGSASLMVGSASLTVMSGSLMVGSGSLMVMSASLMVGSGSLMVGSASLMVGSGARQFSAVAAGLAGLIAAPCSEAVPPRHGSFTVAPTRYSPVLLALLKRSAELPQARASRGIYITLSYIVVVSKPIMKNLQTKL